MKSQELQWLFRILNRGAVTLSADTIREDVMKAFEIELTRVRDILQVPFLFIYLINLFFY